MKSTKISGLVLFFIGFYFILFSSCTKEQGEKIIDCSTSAPSYNNEIKLIINSNCLSSGCHDAGSSNGDYTTYSGLQVVALSGSLERKVVINKTMPVSGSLSYEDRKKIKCWISSGSPNN